MDWRTLPTTAAVVTVLSWASVWLIATKREARLPWPCLVATGAYAALYAAEGAFYLSDYCPLAAVVAFFYFIGANTREGSFGWAARAMPFVLAAEAATGIAQFARTGESLGMTGHFDNPFGFSLCLVFGIPFLLYLARTGGRATRRWAAAGVAATLATIGLAGSRTALLCAGAVAALAYRDVLAEKWRRTKRWQRAAAVTLLIVLAAGAYGVKRDSANGRLLVWGTACEMIADRPWGFGPEGTQREYMNYQARFLEGVEDPYWQNLADNVTYVFSEYLEAGISLGAAGAGAALWLLAATCRRMWRERDEEKRAAAGLLFIAATTGLFSYPLHCPMSWVAAGYGASLAFPARGGGLRWRNRFATGYAAILALALLLARQGSDLQAHREWWRAGMAAQNGDREAVERDYPRLYARLRHYPPFLYNYGVELYCADQYERSEAILEAYCRRTADYDAWIVRGENRRALGRHGEALAAFRKAGAMCPGRVYPLYGQMEIYRDAGDIQRARETAEAITQKPVKVRSAVTESLIEEAQALLNETTQHEKR